MTRIIFWPALVVLALLIRPREAGPATPPTSGRPAPPKPTEPQAHVRLLRHRRLCRHPSGDT